MRSHVREDLVSTHPLFNQVRNPVRHDSGLTAPGPRQDQQRPLDMLHRLTLAGIQAL